MIQFHIKMQGSKYTHSLREGGKEKCTTEERVVISGAKSERLHPPASSRT